MIEEFGMLLGMGAMAKRGCIGVRGPNSSRFSCHTPIIKDYTCGTSLRTRKRVG